MSTSTAYLTNFTSNSLPSSLNSDALQPTKLPMAVLGKRSNIRTTQLGFESIRHFKTATPMFVNTWMSSNWEAHVAYTHLFCTQPHLKIELQE